MLVNLLQAIRNSIDCTKPLHIAQCNLCYSARLEANQHAGEHCNSSSLSVNSRLINRSYCLSLGEVGLKISLQRNSSTGSWHEPVLKVFVGPQPDHSLTQPH